MSVAPCKPQGGALLIPIDEDRRRLPCCQRLTAFSLSPETEIGANLSLKWHLVSWLQEEGATYTQVIRPRFGNIKI